MRNFALGTALIALLTIQSVCAQEIATIPIQQPAATPSPASSTVVLPEGTEVHLVLLGPISSATATKGQSVHFAIAQDNVSPFPPGTAATGVVKSVRKGIPGKQNGSLEIQPRTILLKDGTKIRLMRYEDECDVRVAGCWVLGAFEVVGVVVLGPIALTVAAVHSITHPHQRRLLTPIHAEIEGTDIVHKPCERYTAYTTRKLKISPTQDPASIQATPEALTILDSCAAH
jgi:hypothetical protein